MTRLSSLVSDECYTTFYLTAPANLQSLPMRVAAILHPYAKDKLLEPFRAPGMNLFRGNELEANDLPDVAIVFGGDGSVHRVIQALARSATPLLVVPTGSGNDFAHAIGIRSFDDAVAVWRKFVEGRANVSRDRPWSHHAVTFRAFAESERMGGWESDVRARRWNF